MTRSSSGLYNTPPPALRLRQATRRRSQSRLHHGLRRRHPRQDHRSGGILRRATNAKTCAISASDFDCISTTLPLHQVCPNPRDLRPYPSQVSLLLHGYRGLSRRSRPPQALQLIRLRSVPFLRINLRCEYGCRSLLASVSPNHSGNPIEPWHQ